jgi:peptidoglycan hydrolase-like protein with peptidoglycan-binding domain
MSTQYDTRPSTTPSHHTPRHQRRSGYRAAVITIGSVIAAALVALAAVGLIHHSTTPAASTSAPASTSASSAPSSGSSTNPAVVPSASVKKLQQELGQLNYYEGPVDGIMGAQTTAAIKDLQRQANLPQTGTMNPATQTALDNYLVHGNNQMAG